jgi:predicted metal-dependent HD superfamily phosphohydrolase
MQRLNKARADLIFKDLLVSYQESWRHYHTLDHIRHMLHILDESNMISSMSQEAGDQLILAIWYHDSVYVPFSTKNELLLYNPRIYSRV